MRVLLTVPSLAREFGGPVVKARALARHLTDLGCDVVVAGAGCSDDGDDDDVALGSLHSFHGTPVPRHLAPLRRAVEASDVVHVVGYRDPVGTLAAMWAARKSRPMVLEPAGMHRRRLRSLRLKVGFDTVVGRRVMSAADRIVATSVLERAELVADGVDPSTIVIRPNGVDGIEFDARGGPALDADFRPRFGIPLGAPLVVVIGRLAAKKGLADVLAATRMLPNVWVVIAGPDGGDGTLRELERALPGHGRARVVAGWMDGSDKRAALAAADVFCLPSASENFGTAAAEAAIAGVPVIVSNQCGVIEYLAPAATTVVTPNDRFTLRAAIERVVHDPDRRTAAVAAAPEVRARLRWSDLAHQQFALYGQLVEERAAPRRPPR